MPIADSFPRLRRLSPLILLLAAVVIYFGIVAPHAAEDHAVTLVLQGPTAEVTRVETVWTGIDVHPDEAVGGATFNFPIGTAPSEVRTKIHTAPGGYWLDVTINRGSNSTTIRRRIALNGGDIKVFVPLD